MSWAEIAVARHAFARQIEAREPVGEATRFSRGVGEIYFFTQIVGADAPTEVLHVWIYDGRETAIIPLAVDASPWRTWSSKSVPPEMAGDWTVEVRDRDGVLVLSATCRVE